MSDIVVTTANVKTAPVVFPQVATAGENLLEGQSVRVLADGTARLTDASVSNLDATASGVTITPADTGEAVNYIVSGDYNTGATGLIPGMPYVVSGAAPGGIAPATDIGGSGWWAHVLGVASSTTNITLSQISTTIQS